MRLTGDTYVRAMGGPLDGDAQRYRGPVLETAVLETVVLDPIEAPPEFASYTRHVYDLEWRGRRGRANEPVYVWRNADYRESIGIPRGHT